MSRHSNLEDAVGLRFKLERAKVGTTGIPDAYFPEARSSRLPSNISNYYHNSLSTLHTKYRH